MAAVQADGAKVCSPPPVAGIQACDMLNLILLAILNSQNINHLLPGCLTTLLSGLFARTDGKVQSRAYFRSPLLNPPGLHTSPMQ